MTTPHQARRLLDAWIGVGPPLDERPTRPELKDWVRVGLNDWCRFRAQNDALAAQRDELIEALDAQKVETAKLADVLDAALLERRVARAASTANAQEAEKRTRERDTAERILHERTVEMTKAYEELRAAYDQAEGERNELARWAHWVRVPGAGAK